MKPLFIIAVLMLIASGSPWAQDRAKTTEVKRDPAYTTERTNQNSARSAATDSAAADLQAVVVLCATNPKSKDLAPATKKWLQSNPRAAMDLDAAIADIMRRADEYREKIGKQKRSAESAAEVEKIMRGKAKAAINNIR
jgi:hypothetical protein